VEDEERLQEERKGNNRLSLGSVNGAGGKKASRE